MLIPKPRNFQRSVESTKDGSEFFNERFEAAPEPVYGSCQVTLDADTVMLFGGYRIADKAFKLDVGSGKWSPLPPMSEGRHGPACGVVRGRRAIAVAGGIRGEHSEDGIVQRDIRRIFMAFGLGLMMPASQTLTTILPREVRILLYSRK